MSNEVSAAPIPATAALPTGWTQTVIGTCSAPGSAAYADINNQTFTVTGSGSGIGLDSETGDGLSFVYTKASGDFIFTARRIASKSVGGSHQRMGLMVRQSLDPSARALAMISGDLGGREGRFGARAADASRINWQYGNGYTNYITWMRIKRTADNITRDQSVDGITWYIAGTPVKVPMTGDIYVGLAVSSNSHKVNTASFDNVLIR